jgi:hypothetical protein
MDDNKMRSIAAQLMGARHQIAALSSIVEAALMELETMRGERCSHPNKQDASSFEDGPAWYCPDCGLEWKEDEGVNYNG